MGTATSGGATAIDVRRAVFTALYRDPLLRRLLVNHADRLDGLPARGGGAAERCVLVLRWSGADPARSPAAGQLLTVHAHLPRRAAQPRFLDAVRRRLDGVLLAAPAGAPVRVRRLGGSAGPVAGGDGSLLVSAVYAVALAGPRPTGAALLGLPPWTGHRVGPAGAPAPSRGAPGLN